MRQGRNQSLGNSARLHQPITRGETRGATNRSGKFDELYFLDLTSGESMRLSLWGYPDEVDKREGRSFGCGPSSVYHLPRRSGRSPALPYPPSRRRQFYPFAGRIPNTISFRFLRDATIPISFRFLLDATRWIK